MKARWGGWYVTGHDGNQPHLGNIVIRSQQDLDNIAALRKPDIDTLKGLFDTTPYITDKSDVVALVVLAHQVTVHNLITRANYKTRRFVAHEIDPAQNPDPTWEDFSPKMQKVVKTILEPLVRGLLNADAAPFVAPMVGNAGYDAWFQKQGPKDARGRSLRGARPENAGVQVSAELSHLLRRLQGLAGLREGVRVPAPRRSPARPGPAVPLLRDCRPLTGGRFSKS